jgi:hypothetical protein
MITVRLRERDYWIYPQPIRPGDWRATRNNLKYRSRRNRRNGENRFAWKIRNWFLGHEQFEYFSDEYYDREENGTLEYWAGDVPVIGDD